MILAGKGHNGDDARAAREFLRRAPVELLDVTDPEAASAEARNGRCRSRSPRCVIDGLFGIGLNRPLDDGWKKFIAAVNQSKIPVLAVDVPSGLNADTGELPGAAIEAAVTLTVGAPKTGLLAPSRLAVRRAAGSRRRRRPGSVSARRRIELDVAGGF